MGADEAEDEDEDEVADDEDEDEGVAVAEAEADVAETAPTWAVGVKVGVKLEDAASGKTTKVSTSRQGY